MCIAGVTAEGLRSTETLCCLTLLRQGGESGQPSSSPAARAAHVPSQARLSHYNGSFLHYTPRTEKAKAARDGGELRRISPLKRARKWAGLYAKGVQSETTPFV